MKQPKPAPQIRLAATEDAAADPSLWTLLLLDITSTAVACAVVACAIWALCLTPEIPGPLPGALQFVAAFFAIAVPIFLFRGFLRILPEGAAPYFFVRRHLPERLERDHFLALSGLTLVVVVSVLAPNWRAVDAPKPAPFTRAATARSAQPTPSTSPALLTPVAITPAAERCHLCHLRMLEGLRKRHAKIIKRKRKGHG